MDLTAEFYLQTVETVFIRHALPKGEMMHRGEPVDPGAIRTVALFTVEGENDDISGVGQTKAAHDICAGHPGRAEGALPAAEGRTLRRLQRLALPRRNRAAHRRLHRDPTRPAARQRQARQRQRPSERSAVAALPAAAAKPPQAGGAQGFLRKDRVSSGDPCRFLLEIAGSPRHHVDFVTCN